MFHCRLVLATVALALVLPARVEAIPAWARKYNANCSMCHYPEPPRLNATGVRFRWAGYRQPEEFGEQVDVAQVSNYLAARGRVQYHFEKEDGSAPVESSFRLMDASLFYGGPFGRRYAGFFEIEHEADEFALVANVSSTWGKAGSFWGLRVGQMHWGPQVGVAGFDRPSGIAAPTPIDRPLTPAIPFGFPEHQLGAEAFLVADRLRLSVHLLNGVDSTGSALGPDPDTWKDAAFTGQVLLDGSGSGAQVLGYFGTVKDVVPGRPGQSHYWRVAGSVSKIVADFEALAGGVYGHDYDLPQGFRQPLATNDGVGYWFSGQYFWRHKAALYARYENIDPNLDAANDANARIVGGTVVPLGSPSYLRLALEYWLDWPQDGALQKTHHIAGEVMLTF